MPGVRLFGNDASDAANEQLSRDQARFAQQEREVEMRAEHRQKTREARLIRCLGNGLMAIGVIGLVLGYLSHIGSMLLVAAVSFMIGLILRPIAYVIEPPPLAQ